MTAPAGEVGSVEALPSWGAFSGGAVDSADPPAWLGPNRVLTVNRMRADAQVDSLTNSVAMPVMRMEWRLNPNGARDEVVEQISTDTGIPIKGSNDPAPRSRRRFKHRDHLEHALLAPWYGHMFFEMVPDTERFDLATDGWRLRKLAPRMPASIEKIHVAPDGGLAGISQYGYRPPVQARRRGLGLLQNADPQIGVNALAAYVWKREGANWLGRSMLRPLYGPWALKDRALRVDALKNERFGMGIPVASTPEGGDPNEAARLAQAMRASEYGGVGLKPGQTVGVEGIRGTLPDVLASIRYYDESMARAFMAMVVQLGQTQTGSRALGETFADFFQMLTESVASWYRDTTNEHVIEDLVDWNWGEDEQAPLLEWAYPQGESPLAISDLVSMVDSGVVTMDAETERAVRQQTRLPMTVPPPPAVTRPLVVQARRPPVQAHQLRQEDGRFSAHSHADVGALGAAYEGWAENLTDSERSALEDYVTGSYEPMNSGLRGGESASSIEGVPELDSLISKSPGLTEDTTLYRVVDNNVSVEVGSTFQDNGFTSTTTDSDNTMDWASTSTSSGQYGTVMNIRAKSGQKGAWVPAMGDDFGTDSFEMEMILPRGSKYRVVSRLDDLDPSSFLPVPQGAGIAQYEVDII